MEQRMLKPELKQQHNTNHQTHASGAATHSDQWDHGSTGTTPTHETDTSASHTSGATYEQAQSKAHAYATVEHEYARSSPQTDGELK
jgi:hypothetical protein